MTATPKCTRRPCLYFCCFAEFTTDDVKISTCQAAGELCGTFADDRTSLYPAQPVKIIVTYTSGTPRVVKNDRSRKSVKEEIIPQPIKVFCIWINRTAMMSSHAENTIPITPNTMRLSMASVTGSITAHNRTSEPRISQPNILSGILPRIRFITFCQQRSYATGLNCSKACRQ